MIIELKKEEFKSAQEFLNHVYSEYQDEYPCPKCGSHNVEIDLAALGDGCVCGSEWCNDCGWKKVTNTFPKEKG